MLQRFKRNLIVLGASLFALQFFVLFTPIPAYAQNGLVPCGVNTDDLTTPWDETADCEFRHTFLLLWNVINFVLWKLAPLIIAIMAVITGVLFYFQLGSADTLALVKRMWRSIGIGVVVLIFSWLFLNFLLGVLGFNISVFGAWYSLTLSP